MLNHNDTDEIHDSQDIFEEQDEFDPLAPIAFDDENPEEADYYVEQVPPIAVSAEEAAAARRAKYPIPVLTTAQKIVKTLKGMPGQKKLLLHVIDWCRDERTDTQIVQEIIRFERGGVNVYSPESLISMLVRCGALVQTNAPSEAEPDQANAEDATDCNNGTPAVCAESITPSSAESLESSPANTEDVAPTDESDTVEPVGGTSETADDDSSGNESAEDVSDEDEPQEPEFMQVTPPQTARYLATPEGLAAVAAEDPKARFAAFMDANPVYAPIFRTVLENCDRPGGCTKKEIDALIDNDPICKEPRRWSGYFVDKLEDADAIIFEGGWITTDLGRSLLDEDGIIGGLL